MRDLRVLGIAGSLRRKSFNRSLLDAAVALAPEDMRIETFERLREIPPFDEDLEQTGPPEPVLALTSAIRDADALLFVTPEYNYSVPGVLKNAFDWASRPPTDNPLRGKPAAIMGASRGMSGTIRAQMALRASFQFTETLALPKPEIYVARAHEKFDADGNLQDEKTREAVRRLLVALAEWTRRLAGR